MDDSAMWKSWQAAEQQAVERERAKCRGDGKCCPCCSLLEDARAQVERLERERGEECPTLGCGHPNCCLSEVCELCQREQARVAALEAVNVALVEKDDRMDGERAGVADHINLVLRESGLDSAQVDGWEFQKIKTGIDALMFSLRGHKQQADARVAAAVAAAVERCAVDMMKFTGNSMLADRIRARQEGEK